MLNINGKDLIFETKNVLNYVQNENLLLLHSFIPFVTEELWHLSGFKKTEKNNLINHHFTKDLKSKSSKDVKDILFIINFINDLRSFKSKMQVAPGSLVRVGIQFLDNNQKKIIKKNENILCKIGRISALNTNDGDKGNIKTLLAGKQFVINFGDEIDIDNQINILEKKLESIQKQISSGGNKLNNDNFIKKAPKEIVKQEKNLLDTNKKEYITLQKILKSLK